MLDRLDLPTNGFAGVAVGFVATLLGVLLFPRLVKMLVRLLSGVLLEAVLVIVAGLLTDQAAKKIG